MTPAKPDLLLTIRLATLIEKPALDDLIAASARAHGVGFYNEAQTEAAVTHVFGVDTQLIDDGTYFIADGAGTILGCGGWSRRRTLFGSDNFARRDDMMLDPLIDAARIRAFFVAPNRARHGVASRLLEACESAARSHGFDRAVLMATLPGVPFYAARGYRAGAPIDHLCGAIPVRFVTMEKDLLQK